MGDPEIRSEVGIVAKQDNALRHVAEAVAGNRQVLPRECQAGGAFSRRRPVEGVVYDAAAIAAQQEHVPLVIAEHVSLKSDWLKCRQRLFPELNIIQSGDTKRE